MRKVFFCTGAVFVCVLAWFLQLTFHELGHALGAIITGNEVVDIHLGLVSYAEINVINFWAVPVISIGAFVLPMLVSLLFSLIPNVFTKIFGLVILVTTTIQFGINSVVILFEKNVQVLNTYDLGVILTNTNVNANWFGTFMVIVAVMLLVWLVFNMVKVANEMVEKL